METSPPSLLMYEDSFHPQGSSNSTGMLATCTSETRQHMLRCIVAFSLWVDREEEELEGKKEKKNMILNVCQCHCFTKKEPSLQKAKYLCQSSDWPAHGLISNANKSHSNFLHAHPWRAVVRVVRPIFANLWWQHVK